MSGYLLDTHVLVWWLLEPKRISNEATAILEDPASRVRYSTASIWEMSIKRKLKKLCLPADTLRFVDATGFEHLPISREDAWSVQDLPLLHRDPFDRLLVSQARGADLTLITRDGAVRSYPIPTLEG